MHITYHGLSCIKLVAKTAGRGSDDVTIILGPYSKNTGLRPLQSKVDVAIAPLQNDLFSGTDSLRGEPIILDMPGEYAAKGVNIVSYDAPADHREGVDRGRASISVLDIEGMKIVYLGALGAEPSPNVIDACAGADILFLPVGDEQGMDGKTAEVLARKIEPHIIIPIHYKTKDITLKGLRDIDDFCANVGNCPKESLEKLTIKATDVKDSGTMHITILSLT